MFGPSKKELAQAQAEADRLRDERITSTQRVARLEKQVRKIKEADGAEIMALGQQLGKAALREQVLRQELEERAKRELQLRRRIAKLESQPRDQTRPVPRPAPSSEETEALRRELREALEHIELLQTELGRTREALNIHLEAEAELRHRAEESIAAAPTRLSRQELERALTASRHMLAAMREANDAEIRVLGKQIGQAAARERDLRSELEEKSRTELQLRRKLLKLERELNAQNR